MINMIIDIIFIVSVLLWLFYIDNKINDIDEKINDLNDKVDDLIR